MDLNFFQEISFSDYIPFKFLRRDEIIHIDKAGIVFDTNFNSINIRENWLHLFMPVEGDITQSYDSKGYNDSRCLLITSNCEKSWSLSNNKFIEVKRGDIFSYRIMVNLIGENNTAYVGIDTFDETKKIAQWYYIKNKINEPDRWIALENRFTIDDNIDYIRFRLNGLGIGEFRFDDVTIMKEFNTATHVSSNNK